MSNVIALQGLKISPTVLEPPARARNRKVTNVKILWNLQLCFLSMIWSFCYLRNFNSNNLFICSFQRTHLLAIHLLPYTTGHPMWIILVLFIILSFYFRDYFPLYKLIFYSKYKIKSLGYPFLSLNGWKSA